MSIKAWSSTLLVLCFFFCGALGTRTAATWKNRFHKAGEPKLLMPSPETIICSTAKYNP